MLASNTTKNGKTSPRLVQASLTVRPSKATATPAPLFPQPKPTPKDLGYTPLLEAVGNHDLEKCAQLLDAAPTFEAQKNLLTDKNKNNETAFLMAIRLNYVDMCDFFVSIGLLDEGHLQQALYICARLDRPEICYLLLSQHHIQPRWIGPQNETLLMIAAESGADMMCELLMGAYQTSQARKNYLQTKNNSLKSALLIAAENLNIKAFQSIYRQFRLFLSYGRPIPEDPALNTLDQDLLCILKDEHSLEKVSIDGTLHKMIAKDNRRATLALLRAGVDPNLRDKDGNTPVLTTASSGNLKIYEFLRSKNATVQVTNKAGDTPVLLATRNGHRAFVRRLIADGVDLNGQNKAGLTALMESLQKGHLGIAEDLIQAKANLDTKDNSGTTALLIAWRNKQWGLFDALLAAGANPNVAGEESPLKDGRYTLLSTLITRDKPDSQYYENFQALLKAGAYPNGSQINKHTLLTFCTKRVDLIAYIKLLLKAKADCNEKNAEGDTPLLVAVKNNRLLACKLLLDAGAQLDITDSQGKTALFYAAKKNALDICKVLFASGAAVVDTTDPDMQRVLERPDMADSLRLGTIARAGLFCEMPDTFDTPAIRVIRKAKEREALNPYLIPDLAAIVHSYLAEPEKENPNRLEEYPAARHALRQYIASLPKPDRTNPLLYLPKEKEDTQYVLGKEKDSSCLIC